MRTRLEAREGAGRAAVVIAVVGEESGIDVRK
jgi:hypothetical protein